MEKKSFKPGNMLYPVPAALVSCSDKEGKSNLITVAWTGTICSDPAMLYISLRKSRFSYNIIKESGEFAVNLTTKALVKAADLCGVKSGMDIDKWEAAGLTQAKALSINAPVVEESPVNIECKVKQIIELGSHDMFIAEVTAVQVDAGYLDENGKFELNKTGLIAYSHGEYLELGKALGSFGYSVKKRTGSGKRSKK